MDKEKIAELIKKFIYDNVRDEIIRTDYVNDGDDHWDFMGIKVDEEKLSEWLDENIESV